MFFPLFVLANAQETPTPDAALDTPAADASPVVAPLPPRTPALPIQTTAVEPAEARLGDRITLTVQNLPALLATVQDDCSALVLYIDGLPLMGTPPMRCDPDSGHVGFVLERNEADDQVWHELLGRPTAGTRDVQVTIGTASNRSYPRLNNKVTLELLVLPQARLVTFAVVSLGLLFSMFYLASRTALLRDPAAGSGLGDTERPYSLARSQQVFWLVLSALAYTFVWLMTSELNTLTASVLGLIGISAGTFLGSEIVDESKKTGLQQTYTKLEGDRTAALTTAERAIDSPAAMAAAQQQADKAASTMSAVKDAMTVSKTEGFWRDICTDASGVSLQRTQVVAWTIVLGVIFVFEVYAKLTMPEFGPELLALMGLSSGAFVAGKAAENRVQG